VIVALSVALAVALVVALFIALTVALTVALVIALFVALTVALMACTDGCTDRHGRIREPRPAPGQTFLKKVHFPFTPKHFSDDLFQKKVLSSTKFSDDLLLVIYLF